MRQRYVGGPIPNPTIGIQKGRGQGKPRPSRANRSLIAERALGAVRNALTEGGMNSADALRYARIALTRPGVTLGKGGSIYYHGKRFDATAFAKSPLVQYVTGQKAAAQNQQAVTSDAGYQQALATLGLTRDQGIAALAAQRRNAEIQFGDPSFVQGDPLTAAAAGANPFSTVQLLALQKQRADQAAQAAANRMGTLYGGGYQSGLQENQRVNAAQNQDATTKLQQLLAEINSGIGNAQQAYTVGQNSAYQQAYQDMIKAGTIHAAQPPNLTAGTFNYHLPQPTPIPQTGHQLSPPPFLPPTHLAGGAY